MYRYAKYAVPLILKAPRRSPVKALAGLFACYAMLFVGTLFLVTAAFIWTLQTYGTDAAFLAVGLFFTTVSIAFLLWFKRSQIKRQSLLPASINQDPLANYIPESLKENPTVQKLLMQISENPIAATATAATIGMLLSKEFLED